MLAKMLVAAGSGKGKSRLMLGRPLTSLAQRLLLIVACVFLGFGAGGAYSGAASLAMQMEETVVPMTGHIGHGKPVHDAAVDIVAGCDHGAGTIKSCSMMACCVGVSPQTGWPQFVIFPRPTDPDTSEQQCPDIYTAGLPERPPRLS